MNIYGGTVEAKNESNFKGISCGNSSCTVNLYGGTLIVSGGSQAINGTVNFVNGGTYQEAENGDEKAYTETRNESSVYFKAIGHTHSWDSTEWKYDATKHWKECDCGEKSEEAAHTESTPANCQTAAYCDVCKKNYGEKDANQHEKTEATWTVQNATQHEQKWECCGTEVVALADHNWVGGKCSTEGCDYECQHSLEYTADQTNLTIMQGCTTCNHSATAKLLVDALHHSGDYQDTVETQPSWVGADPTISYGSTDTTKAGTYTATLSAGGATVSTTYKKVYSVSSNKWNTSGTKTSNLIDFPTLPTNLGTGKGEDVNGWKTFWTGKMEPFGWNAEKISVDSDALQVYKEDSVVHIRPASYGKVGDDASLGNAKYEGGVSYTVAIDHNDLTKVATGEMLLNASMQFWCQGATRYHASIRVHFYDEQGNELTLYYKDKTENAYDKGGNQYRSMSLSTTIVPAETAYFTVWFSDQGNLNARKAIKNLKVTLTYTGDNHTHTYDQAVEEAEYLASSAVCGQTVSYYYSCECGESSVNGTQTTFKRTLSHSYAFVCSASCSNCGEPNPSPQKHDFGPNDDLDECTLCGYARHKHPICGANCAHTGHTAIDFNEAMLDAATTLTTGNYQLFVNQTLTGDLTISGDVTLCLNGNQLDLNGYKLIIPNGASLTITDCQTAKANSGSLNNGLWTADPVDPETGKVEYPGNTPIFGGVLHGGSAEVKGSIVLYNGTIAGLRGGVRLTEGGAMTVTGGKLCYNVK